jgi:hypothetical protein
MDKKIILELIKKDINELQLLTEAMTKNPDHDNILLEVSIGRAQTLLSQFDLLKSMQGESKPAANSVVETKIEAAAETEAKAKVEIENKTENAISNPIQDTELSASNTSESSETINNNNIQETGSPKNEKEEDLTADTPNSPETPAKDEHTQAPTVTEAKTESNTTTTEVKEEKTEIEKTEEEKEEIAENSDEKKPQIFGEQFTKEPSLNERFSDLQKTRAAVIGHPVHSLKKAIGLNDRFMYTRELFENNSDKFDKAIEALDKAQNIIDAIEYLEQNFKWKKTDASLKFMELVKRRHGNVSSE